MTEFDDSVGLPLGPRTVGAVSVVIGVTILGLTWQRWILSSLLGWETGWLDRVPFILLGLVVCFSGSNLLVTSATAWRWARVGFFLSAPALFVLGVAFIFRTLEASREPPTELTARIVAEFPWGASVALFWSVVVLVTAIRLGEHLKPKSSPESNRS